MVFSLGFVIVIRIVFLGFVNRVGFSLGWVFLFAEGSALEVVR